MEMQDTDSKLDRFLKKEKSYLEDLKEVDLKKNWVRFQQTEKVRSPKAVDYLFRPKYRFLFRAAAAAILLLVVVSGLYITTYLPTDHMVQACAEPGHTDFLLSDGTAISLNVGAVLNYPEKLKHRVREVSLSGEAFFEVKRADKSPFYVYVGEMIVQVAGTSFNIREDVSGSIEVSVIEGKVLFYPSGMEDEAIRLSAGQRSVYRADQQELEIEETASENFLFWKTGTLIYEDTPLQKVFVELELYFKRKIVMEDPEILKNRWYSTHQGQTLYEIIDELCLYFDLEWIERNDTILVQK